MATPQQHSTAKPTMYWIILSFFPFANWLPMVVAGVNARVKQWWVWGAIYFIPTLLIFILINPSGSENMGPVKSGTTAENLIFMAFFISYFASIVHVFSIRKAYKEARVRVLKGYAPNNEQTQKEPQRLTVLQEANNLSQDILQRMKQSKYIDDAIVKEIRPMVNTYMKQLNQLIDKDKQLKRMLTNSQKEDIEQHLEALKAREEASEDPEMKMEYKHTMEQYAKQLDTLKEFQEQREKIQLRITNTLTSLRQLKYDLVKIEQLSASEQRNEVFHTFDEKIKDLSAYLQALDDAYSGKQ